MSEYWADIVGYEGMYQISNLGNVKSLERLSPQGHLVSERIMRQYKNNSGYKIVDLTKNGTRKHWLVHRLVAEAFVENPNGYNEVDHIDTNKDNNSADNLRWCTHSQNHLNPLTVIVKSNTHKGKKLSAEQVEKISKKVAVYKDGELLHIFKSYKDLDMNSEEILGTKLWNVYARQVVNGERESYKGFTFKSA